MDNCDVASYLVAPSTLAPLWSILLGARETQVFTMAYKVLHNLLHPKPSLSDIISYDFPPVTLVFLWFVQHSRHTPS